MALFPNLEPLARTSDPETSHRSAREITESHLRDSQKAAVLKALQECPEPITSAELAVRMAVDRHMVARRLPDLKADGRVDTGQIRICRVGSRAALTWRAV